MTAKEFKKHLAKVPDDAVVSLNEDIPIDCNAMFYDVETNRVLLGVRDAHMPTEIPLYKSKRDVPYLDKIWLGKAHRFFDEGKRKVEEKHDGKAHEIQVIFSRWDQYFFGAKLNRCEWMTLVVDNYRERGKKLGVGRQWTVCKAKRFSPI